MIPRDDAWIGFQMRIRHVATYNRAHAELPDQRRTCAGRPRTTLPCLRVKWLPAMERRFEIELARGQHAEVVGDLVSRVVNSATVRGEAVEDVVGGAGPDERFRIGVPGVDPELFSIPGRTPCGHI